MPLFTLPSTIYIPQPKFRKGFLPPNGCVLLAGKARANVDGRAESTRDVILQAAISSVPGGKAAAILCRATQWCEFAVTL